jgi:T5SS/PEP-CTERM-associated repeat protein/autotransporter-associated beta strand protein
MTHCSLHPTRRGRRAAPTLLALAAALALSAPGPALATDYTWVGGAQPLPTNWSFAANWANSLRAVSADDTVLRFPNSFAAASNDISVGFRLNALRAFENGQPGGGTMGGLALALSGTAPEILVGALGTLNLNAPLTGTVHWQKTGAGNLVLGASNSGLAGSVVVAGGQLHAADAQSLNANTELQVAGGASARLGAGLQLASLAGAGALQLDGTTTLNVATGATSGRTFAGSITGLGSLVKAGAGDSFFTGSASHAGATQVSGGSLQLLGPDARFSGGSSLVVGGGATASVSGAGAQWVVVGNLDVGSADMASTAQAVVRVQGGALLGNGDMRMGDLGRSGKVALTGAASRWQSTGHWTVGGQGNGEVTLAEGSATARSATLAALAGSQGTLSLGQQARMDISAGLTVGDMGAATLDIAGGSLLRSGTASAALTAGGTATIGVRQSTDSQGWIIAGDLQLGRAGAATLTVSQGGQVTNVNTELGAQASGVGNVEVTGAGSRWLAPGSFGAGVLGEANVQVLAGGQVGTGRVTLGSAHAGVGRVTVSGDGSAWVGTGAVDVGDVGQGWLTVSQGGSWASQSASLGSQVSGSGHLRVDHGGSFSQTLGLAVGALGTGELQVDQGGLVSNGSAVIGQGGLSHGKAVVIGANASRVSTWQNNGHLRVGESGVGELWVSDGGLVQSAQATLGRLSGGSGSAVVGAGTARVAEWASTGPLTVGDQGSGLLQVQSGGLVRSQGAVVGQVLGAIGEVLVSGDASGTERASWVNGGSLQVGAQGQGSMAVRSGGLVSNRGAGIGGANLGSLGEVTVAGLGAQGQFATWQVDGDLAIGVDLQAHEAPGLRGTLNVQTGGWVMSSGVATIGSAGVLNLSGGTFAAAALAAPSGGSLNWTGGRLHITGAQGVTLGVSPYLPSVLVLNPGMTLEVDHRLDIGTGTVVLVGGGQVRAGDMHLGGGHIVGAALNLGASGLLSGHGSVVAAVTSANADGRVAVEGGDMSLGNLNSSTGFVVAGTVDVQAGRTLLLQSAGAAGLGANTWLHAGSRLQAVNGLDLGAGEVLTATGDAWVGGRFSNQGFVQGPVAGGQWLVFNDDVSGAGNFGGAVRFNQGYAPGAGAAVVDLGLLGLANSSVLVLDVAGTTPGGGHDQLRVAGQAWMDGTLALDFAGGFVPQAGQSLVLMSYAGHSGQFDSLRIDGLAQGLQAHLMYDTSELRLNISAVPEPKTWALMLGGMLALQMLARRRRTG